MNAFLAAVLLLETHARSKCDLDGHVKDNVYDSVPAVFAALTDSIMKCGLLSPVDAAALVSPTNTALVSSEDVVSWNNNLNSFLEALKSPLYRKWNGTQMAQYFLQCFQTSVQGQTLKEMKKIGAELNAHMLAAQRLQESTGSASNSRRHRPSYAPYRDERPRRAYNNRERDYEREESRDNRQGRDRYSSRGGRGNRRR
ncbi:hypothetical protein HDU99_005578 [Rhizoclosmatium hyalinum]|nr:hypothetical protein HDU99_005578 [Rhizoclosmatium hyalinum]